MNQIKHDIKAELKLLIEENNPGIVKFLEKHIKSHIINLLDFEDIVEEFYLIDPEYFMYYLYPIIHTLTKDFFPEHQIYEMERKIFQKLSLFEGEVILTDFNGSVSLLDNSIDGRIYLTNYRIVVHGILKISEDPVFGTMGDKPIEQGGIASQIGLEYAFTTARVRGTGSGGIFTKYRPYEPFSSSGYRGSTSIGFNSFRGIGFTGVRLTKEDSSKARTCFGYQIPIINSSKISRKNNIVKYLATFKHQFKMKTKKQKVHFKISVSIPKGIKPKDYSKETEDILKVLEQTITQYSKELR